MTAMTDHLRDRLVDTLKRTQMMQRNRGSEIGRLTPVPTPQEQPRTLQAATDQHEADLREQADGVLDALGLADHDAAVRRMARVIEDEEGLDPGLAGGLAQACLTTLLRPNATPSNAGHTPDE